jgi:hypothetical protein
MEINFPHRYHGVETPLREHLTKGSSRRCPRPVPPTVAESPLAIPPSTGAARPVAPFPKGRRSTPIARRPTAPSQTIRSTESLSSIRFQFFGFPRAGSACPRSAVKLHLTKTHRRLFACGSRTADCVFDVSAGLLDCGTSVFSSITNIFVWASTNRVLYSIWPVDVRLLAGGQDEQRKCDGKVTMRFHVHALSMVDWGK